MNKDLRDKKALVCGSTQGIGRACARALAEAGAHVTLLARNADALKTVTASLPKHGAATHNMLIADFADPDSVHRTVQAAVAAAGTFHILINNTGGPAGGPIADARPEEFLNAFRAHVVCNQLLAQAVIPGMKAVRFGRIINIISTSVKAPIPGLGVSNTIRGAVASWAKTLAAEVAPFGITVNNVLPGFTRTERLGSLIKARASKQGMTEEQVAQDMIKTIPAGRFGEAEEIASVVAFLATPAASYVNGINVPVDGGRTQSL